MGERKLIAVIGATGAQGGALARAILADPDGGFGVRAITRNPDSEKARALAAAGAEVVQADLDDLESLKRAFANAWGAYCVTNFWEHFSPERELAQAENLARAAKEAGVRHVVWSTLEDTREWVPLDDDRMPTLMEKYKVPHYDAKGEANHFFTDLGVPTTFLQTSFYWENFIHFGSGPKRGEDGVLALVFPLGEAKLPSIAVEDIGRCAYALFRLGEEAIGRTYSIAGGHPTGEEMASAMGAALGEEVRYVDVPPETYRGLGFPGAEDLGNMFQFKRDFNEDYAGVRDLERTRALNPDLQSFEEWLTANADRIPLE